MDSSAASLVISPFWQSVDERWIGAAIVALAALVVVSTAMSLLRARSLSMFLLTMAFWTVSAVLIAPIADSRSPKLFQLWLMSPETLTNLSLYQILITILTVFASIRQEAHSYRTGFLHHLRSWVIAIVVVLPSPVLLVFILWIEQNIMLTTQQTTPVTIGLQVGLGLVALLGMIAFILIWLRKYQLISLHLFLGCLLIAAAFLLPCLTQKLSISGEATTYEPPSIYTIPVVIVLLGIVAYGAFKRPKLKKFDSQPLSF